MRLTVHTDYALRILMFAASRQDRLFSIAEVASAFAISRNHVMKIVQRLAGAGYLVSFRGRNGGLKLGAAAESARLGALIRFLEDDCALVVCFDNPHACRIGGHCGLQRILGDALRAFFTELDTYTLRDLALNSSARNMLAALQSIPPAS